MEGINAYITQCKYCSLGRKRSEQSRDVNNTPVNPGIYCGAFRNNNKVLSFHLSPWISAALCFMALMHVGLTFNLDVSKAIEFKGPHDQSYFGYTVAMLNYDQYKWCLFGAPRDNNTFLPNSSFAGALYKCTIQPRGTGHACEEVFVDDKESLIRDDSVKFNGTTRLFIHGRSDQWLGASLDVHKDKGIVVCASRWYNQKFRDNYFFMNGICYELPLDFTRANIRKIPALVDGNKQTMSAANGTKLNYGMGSLGSSAHYTSEGVDLLLGAPGLRTWTGGFVDLRQSDVYMSEYGLPATEMSELAGYALTSGKYFGDGHSYFAIGAPRDSLTGKVYLYRSDRLTFVMEDSDLTIDGSDIAGVDTIPLNGFFGAALYSTDVNKDGYDDLIIGAPLYSKGIRQENGAVFVYLGKFGKILKPMTNFLIGSGADSARFGSAISGLDDINKDTYNDIIVGAPYEDNLKGAVYIYNGCSSGIWPIFSQRITSSSLHQDLMSFGISFSKPQDMDNDGIPDILVGAYLSDKAYLMFGQPLINLEITIETSVDQIDTNTSKRCLAAGNATTYLPCFTVKVCFNYDYKDIPKLYLNITTVLDTYIKNYPRLLWQSNVDSSLDSQLTLFTGALKCTNEQNVIIQVTSDLITPVRLIASYKVNIPSSGLYIEPIVNRFDGQNPERALLIATKTLDFKRDCPNNDCKTDLHLSAVVEYDNSIASGFFVIGTSPLLVEVTITKSGHPSYSSNVFVSYSNTLRFQKVQKMYGDAEINCGFVESNDDTIGKQDLTDAGSHGYLQSQNFPAKSADETMLACSFGNPMSNDSGVSFKLAMDVPESTTATQLTFRLNATTLSEELQPNDNVLNLTVLVRNKVSTNFTGVSRPSYITFYDTLKEYVTTHTFELRNHGPSPLPLANMMIKYPQVQTSGKAELYLNKTTWSCLPPCKIKCSFPDSAQNVPVVVVTLIGQTYAINQQETEDKVGESKGLTHMKHTDCKAGNCPRYQCELTDIPARESAVVNMQFVISGNILPVVASGRAVALRSEATVTIVPLYSVISSAREHSIDVLTDLLPLSQPPRPFAWWIILLSVVAGLILIVITVLILWKVGFFKRKSMEEMKKMQHTAEVEKMLPDNNDEVFYSGKT